MGDPGDLKNLPDKAGKTTDPEFSTLIPQLFGSHDDGTKSHAADVSKIAKISDEARKAL